MVVRSKGFRSKTRSKLARRASEKGLTPVTHSLRSFDEGSKVNININSSIHKGMPHPRFQGFTGTVVGKQGTAFIVSVRVGGLMKTVIARPEHLKANA
ncbi:MAG TPA: 50S ribosomal protein L21e [Candidatus Thermoplasmatota archaeon]|nr:50S ribosomal protein L21e [Candidatus Thermoplasmatota archaeon]